MLELIKTGKLMTDLTGKTLSSSENSTIQKDLLKLVFLSTSISSEAGFKLNHMLPLKPSINKLGEIEKNPRI
jgi:hypothetical protein